MRYALLLIGALSLTGAYHVPHQSRRLLVAQENTPAIPTDNLLYAHWPLRTQSTNVYAGNAAYPATLVGGASIVPGVGWSVTTASSSSVVRLPPYAVNHTQGMTIVMWLRSRTALSTLSSVLLGEGTVTSGNREYRAGGATSERHQFLKRFGASAFRGRSVLGTTYQTNIWTLHTYIHTGQPSNSAFQIWRDLVRVDDADFASGTVTDTGISTANVNVVWFDWEGDVAFFAVYTNAFTSEVERSNFVSQVFETTHP